MKKDIQEDVLFSCNRGTPCLEGSRSPLRSGRRKTEVPRTSCAVSRSHIKRKRTSKRMSFFHAIEALRASKVRGLRSAPVRAKPRSPGPRAPSRALYFLRTSKKMSFFRTMEVPCNSMVLGLRFTFLNLLF